MMGHWVTTDMNERGGMEVRCLLRAVQPHQSALIAHAHRQRLARPVAEKCPPFRRPRTSTNSTSKHAAHGAQHRMQQPSAPERAPHSPLQLPSAPGTADARLARRQRTRTAAQAHLKKVTPASPAIALAR